MKIKILIVAFIPLAAVITFSSSARADQTAPSQQAPATSSTEPAQSVWDGIYTEEQDNPGSLSRQQTADILAFVLSKGGFPGGKTELAREAEVLKAIRFEANKPETAGDDETPRQLEGDRTMPTAAAASRYHVITRIPIPGDTGW